MGLLNAVFRRPVLALIGAVTHLHPTTLREDDRGRVPFALVGVLLLVTSATYTGVLTTQTEIADRTGAERALSTTQTATHLAIEQATIDASAEAASNPLVEPADTPMGRTLDGSHPFERYLRLRIYQHTRQVLTNVSTTVGATTVNATVPPVRDPASARAAIDRTRVEPVDDGRRLRVTIEAVRLRIVRHGDVVGTQTMNVSVVAATPVLALHRRTTTFDRRLSNGPFEGPGMGRRVTAGLLLTAQTRGLAQYGKAPIANVLPNRHVALQTNAAALTIQHDAFGTTDPQSTGSVAWAAGRVGLQDIAAMGNSSRHRWSERVLSRPSAATPAAAAAALDPEPSGSPERNVSARRVADRALLDVVGPDHDRVVAAVEQAYSIDARLIYDTHRVSRTTTTTGTPPNDGILVSTNTSTTRHAIKGPVPHVSAGPGFDLVATDSRRVVTMHRTTRTWETTAGPTQVVETTRTVTVVEFGVATRYEPGPVPDRPVVDSAGRHRLDRAAVNRLLGPSSQRSELAARIVGRTVDTAIQQVSVEPPERVLDAAQESVFTTHRRTRNLSTASASTAPPGTDRSALTESTGVTDLAEVLDANHASLLDVPAMYEGPAAVARTNARQTYLDAVKVQLDSDASRVSTRDGELRDFLDAQGVTIPESPKAESMLSGLGDSTDSGVSVSLTPSYLPVTEVTPEMANIDQSYHPLAARNINLFTVPSGDIADSASSAVVPSSESESTGTVDIAVAARTLAASNDSKLPRNESLGDARQALRAHVKMRMGKLEHAQVRALTRSTSLSAAASSGLVDSTLAEYPTVASRALALTNGTIPRKLATRAASRTNSDKVVLASRLRVAANQARNPSDARIPGEAVEVTGSLTRDVAREGVNELVGNGVENGVERLKKRQLSKTMAGLPAGLPIAPVPGSWYVTVNVWVVDVLGAYHRVEARSTVTSPNTGPDGLSYVREAESIERDVDGDGVVERLGRNQQVAFNVTTAVLVVVPAGPRGVGDTDGNMDERSPGWPGPEAALNESLFQMRNETGTTPPSIGSP